jgi:drug/metabolite transporter (DMT)-like permease
MELTMIIGPELAAVTFGLFASLSWGVGSFSGGLATKRAAVMGVVTVAHIIGLLLMITLAIISSEPLPPTQDLMWGGLAGLAGLVGVAALYRALAFGRMSLAAPTAAVLAALVPALVGILLYGLPTLLQLAGFGFGIASLWLASYSRNMLRETSGLGLAVLAGVGFAGFFILIDRIDSEAVFWPVAAARLASASVLVIAMLVLHRNPIPRGKQLWTFVVLAGLLDTGGGAFFALATQSGRLDIAAVVSSLYPAVTVLLARIVLKEQITRVQALGVVTALIAISLIALG